MTEYDSRRGKEYSRFHGYVSYFKITWFSEFETNHYRYFRHTMEFGLLQWLFNMLPDEKIS